MIMSMAKRLQIPITEGERCRLQNAARREGLTLAEWARRRLHQEAERVLGGPETITPQQALDRIFALEAPVADVETMIEESLRGRFT